MKSLLALILAASIGLTSVGCVTQGGKNDSGGSATMTDQNVVVQAPYPTMAKYPDEMSYVDEKTGEFDNDGFGEAYNAWIDTRKIQQRQSAYDGGLDAFLLQSIPAFLTGESGENRAYSPLNVYMALAMLAETAHGESRAQLLSLLGAGQIEDVRREASELWNANYCDDGAVSSVLASSLWLNENLPFRQDTLETLAKYYYASTYQGRMGSEEYNESLRGWINAQTGGLLKDSVGGLSLDAETMMALVTTVYFRAKWEDEFSEDNTRPAVFHGTAGDVQTDFMHQSRSQTYFWGGKFSAVCQSLENSGGMWFLLPDEGVTPEELLADQEAMSFLLDHRDWENNKYQIVNMSVPKFDIRSNLEFSGILKGMGVTDVFDSDKADFSNLTEEDVYVSQAEHAVRVMIDEEGCAAAAYTVIPMAGAAMPPEEEVDFILDRPFVFAITGTDGLPLFVGIVNQA